MELVDKNKTYENIDVIEEKNIEINKENKLEENKIAVNTLESTSMCKRCLLKDIPGEAYFKNLYEYIATMDEEFKVDGKEYEKRLDLCKTCDNLLNGMCRVCGCFVEMRAIMNTKHCPGKNKLW